MGGEIFRTCPDRPWGPPSFLYNGYRVFLGGKERPGRDADSSPTSSAVGHERVELYLYPPSGPYGLYKGDLYLYLYFVAYVFVLLGSIIIRRLYNLALSDQAQFLCDFRLLPRSIRELHSCGLG